MSRECSFCEHIFSHDLFNYNIDCGYDSETYCDQCLNELYPDRISVFPTRNDITHGILFKFNGKYSYWNQNFDSDLMQFIRDRYYENNFPEHYLFPGEHKTIKPITKSPATGENQFRFLNNYHIKNIERYDNKNKNKEVKEIKEKDYEQLWNREDKTFQFCRSTGAELLYFGPVNSKVSEIHSFADFLENLASAARTLYERLRETRDKALVFSDGVRENYANCYLSNIFAKTELTCNLIKDKLKEIKYHENLIVGLNTEISNLRQDDYILEIVYLIGHANIPFDLSMVIVEYLTYHFKNISKSFQNYGEFIFKTCALEKHIQGQEQGQQKSKKLLCVRNTLNENNNKETDLNYFLIQKHKKLKLDDERRKTKIWILKKK